VHYLKRTAKVSIKKSLTK